MACSGSSQKRIPPLYLFFELQFTLLQSEYLFMAQPFKRIEHAFINGQWINSKNSLEVLNPATGECLGKIPDLSSLDITQAIDAAEQAFHLWASTTPLARANILLRWETLILENKEALAQLLSMEGGKPIAEARAEIDYGVSFIRWFAEEARRINGEVIPSEAPDKCAMVLKQPIGVVGAITPWNFPHAMITRKCAPALAAGCTLVLKPSELTPFSALALAQLALEAGLPKGVLNIVTGTAEPIGKVLCEDTRVKKISFTGSTQVGKWLMAQSASTLKRLSLELGGNAPLIIFEDAHLDNAVEETLRAKFRNNGQTCVCPNRIFVHQSILPIFTEKLLTRIKTLLVGNPLEENTQLGPLINEKAVEKVERLVQDAIAQGAHCLAGGKRHALNGNYFEPTLLTHAHPSMRICQEEIFGPVATLISFTADEKVLTSANSTPAGLAAYLFTENPARIWHMTENLEYGMVATNTGMVSSVAMPFGGVKFSGFGREGSSHGIEEYLYLKSFSWKIKSY